MITYYQKIFFLFIICINFCYSNILTHSKKNPIIVQFENELIENINNDIYESNREKLIKIGLSALFPGLGHFYSKQYKIGAIYSAFEIGGWIGRDYYLSKAKDSSAAYKAYAKENWSLANWFKYYFSPIGDNAPDINYWFTHVDSDGDGIDEEIPFRTPWEFSHEIRYYDIDGNIISTNGNLGKDNYLEICDTSEADDYECNATIDQIEERIGDVAYDHHFFEGLGKYNMYFAGFKDNQEASIEIISGEIIYTPYKKHYENVLRANHKDNNNAANDLLSALLINRAVSILDIILRKNNNKISIDTASNYDITNRYRINSIKLSIAIH